MRNDGKTDKPLHPDTGHKFTYQQMANDPPSQNIPGHAVPLDDDIPRIELMDQARQPCHCSGFRCAAHLAQDELRRKRPKVVMITTGDTFPEELLRLQFEHEVVQDTVVIMPIWNYSTDKYPMLRHRKEYLDLADELFVNNVGGRVDETMAADIEYAELSGKPIRCLEPPAELCKVCGELIPPDQKIGSAMHGLPWQDGFAHTKCLNDDVVFGRKVDP